MAGTTFHPFLFLLIAMLAIVEVGLNAWFVDHFDDVGWPTDRFHSLILLFLFTASWTALFALAYVWWIFSGAMHFLASVAGSTLFLVITATLWVVAAALFHDEIMSWDCTGQPIVSMCREAEAIEALGWTEFALCIITILAACFWVHSSRRNYRGSYYV
ncbi:hypothetical protein EXIGLDRAFT_748248 [Exidia glandulosa HHB12029]|uniref:MARVEL domain-containing protein n=1 Tax=Exidia glandulosa HHB12029 TaxID=1314781 RepID=A0A165JQN8_EXIGL|nr:hypothetical protein EXIGLDRAFT_748248 [Exidia glandulosa HHB12029]